MWWGAALSDCYKQTRGFSTKYSAKHKSIGEAAIDRVELNCSLSVFFLFNWSSQENLKIKNAVLPTILNTRLVLLLSQILLGISCFQYEACQDRAMNPKGSALLSSVFLISTPRNTPMLCSLFSQMHITILIVPLSLLCILLFWLALLITETARSDEEGFHLYSSPNILILPGLYQPSSLHFPDGASPRVMLGLLPVGYYCIGFCYSCLYPIILWQTSASWLRLLWKPLAIPCLWSQCVATLLYSAQVLTHTYTHTHTPSHFLCTQPTGF